MTAFRHCSHSAGVVVSSSAAKPCSLGRTRLPSARSRSLCAAEEVAAEQTAVDLAGCAVREATPPGLGIPPRRCADGPGDSCGGEGG